MKITKSKRINEETYSPILVITIEVPLELASDMCVMYGKKDSVEIVLNELRTFLMKE